MGAKMIVIMALHKHDKDITSPTFWVLASFSIACFIFYCALWLQGAFK